VLSFARHYRYIGEADRYHLGLFWTMDCNGGIKNAVNRVTSDLILNPAEWKVMQDFAIDIREVLGYFEDKIHLRKFHFVVVIQNTFLIGYNFGGIGFRKWL
jgi:hypothetical protein